MIAFYGGWLANALLLGGSFWVGAKRKTGFALIALGEACWLTTLCHRTPLAWDMVFICCVFGLMAAINFARWHWMELQEQVDGTDESEA
jgi:hypothetical protein